MGYQRFYVAQQLSLGEHELPEQTAHYMARVLRLDVGARIQVFDGSGDEFLAKLTRVGKKSVTVQLTEKIAGLAESPLKVHLGQGLSKGERMDWAIQKATELGVTHITPLFTEHCEVRLNKERAEKRLEHW
ncbi:MAG: 16S rRNA (uracil(1498)-N(3))-methyltransferase, partial [Gammaproteobacteria bacterium]|nr:16S rRNA (uracil(1498)-N(3))-methyltransferase [Gammaproteobacteria bacterium]